MIKKNPDHKIQVLWSECGDLNSGPLGPEPSALPSALHPVFDSFVIIMKENRLVKWQNPCISLSAHSLFRKRTNFSSGKRIIICTRPAAIAAIVLEKGANDVTESLPVIHPCSHVENRIRPKRTRR